MNKTDKYLKEKIDSFTKTHKGKDPEEILADMRGKNLITDAMTQEEKAKAYDEKLKRAKQLLETSVAYDRFTIEKIFPELCESVDEKVRKQIRELLLDSPTDELRRLGIDLEKAFNWLEKQKSVGEIVEKYKNSWYNEGKIAGMAEGLTDDEKYQQGWHDALEKLCANSATITKGNTSVTNAEVVSHPTVIDSDSGKCTTASTTIKPKFKVGDFIVNDYCMGRVVELTNDAYLLDTEQGIPFSYEHNVHLWSIKDAKDGDIIYIKRYKDNSEWLLIFKEIKSQNTLIDVYDYYAYSITTGNVYYNYCDGLWGLLLDDEIVCPATKEQCNLLFAKMKEEGFEWDAEKKELKEIGQNPIDKFEPKFHEGDIVIKNTGFIGQILEVGDNEYILTNTGFIPFKYEHLWSRWTIEDAKDGDVLCVKYGNDEFPFIFTGKQDNAAYCALNSFGEFVLSIADWLIKTSVLPATKEQRDLLFQKMKEAGYEWDVEKKELKLLITNGGDFESENCGQKPTWSKEDERIYHSLLADIRASQNGSTNTLETYYNEQIDWLKSLKEKKLKGK